LESIEDKKKANKTKIKDNIKEIIEKWEREMSKGYAKLATLALLGTKEEGLHGYHLVDLIREKTLHFITLNPSSIYPILNSLETRDFIKSKQEIVSGRARKVYTITELGKNILSGIIARQRKIQNKFRSIFNKLSIILDLELPEIPDEMFTFDIERIQEEKSKDELINDLELHREYILGMIKKYTEREKEISKDLRKLKSNLK
jgi:DNA-binding PadR family transcriptional regulator